MTKRRIAIILLIIAAAVAAVGALCVLIINVQVKSNAAGRIVSADNDDVMGADAILVLGAGIKKDGSPSDMLADRIKVGVSLYEAGASDVLLMSGDGARKGYDETATMKRVAVEAGVPESDVVCDTLGLSTYESILRARDEYGAKRIVVVTQEYHLYRALYIADRLGVSAVGVSADLRPYRGQTYRELREILARVKDFMMH